MKPQIYEALSLLGDKDTFRNNSAKHPDHTFKVIKTLNLMDQYTKKLTSQVADAVKVKGAAIDESAETVEKAKTTINNIVMYYHNEVTHPDEVHEECVVQF